MPKGKKGKIMTNLTASRVRTNRFVLDFVNKTITGSASAFKKANTGYGPEYEELVAKMNAHPDFKLVVIEPKKPATAKRTYKGLNDQFITEYISIQVEAPSLAKERAEIEKWAEDTGRKVFPTVKKWFLDKFSTEEQPFDMEEAKEAICKAVYEKAERGILHLVQKEEVEETAPVAQAL